MKYLLFCFFLIIFFLNSAFATTGKLKVAIFLEPPYVDLVNDILVGENIEIINLLAESINLTPLFIHCPLIRCLAMMKSGQADMILGLSKSVAREKDLIFLNPPYLVQHQPVRFFTLKKNNIAIENLNDLESLLVGTLRGSAYFPRFDNDKKIEKVELTSSDQLINMLLKGRIDTFIDREETVLPLLPAAEYQNKITMAHYQYNKPINSYIVLSKHSHAKNYTKKLSQILAKAMTDGTIERIKRTNRDNLMQKTPSQ